MGTRISTVALAASLLCTPVLSAEAHKLANSRELGVEISAIGGEKWCQRQLTLSVQAQDADIYGTADFTDLIKKLGQVLETECPAARHAEISGIDADNTLVYAGSASSSNGWVVSGNSENLERAGSDWSAIILGWLTTIAGWASALRP